MALAPGYRANLETIVRAAKADRLAVLECERRDTGKVVAVLVALSDTEEGGALAFVPFAEMFDGDPYEMLNPPDPAGGFGDHEGEPKEVRR